MQLNTSSQNYFKSRKRLLFVESNLDGTIGGSYFSLFFLVNGLDKTFFDPLVVFEAYNELIPCFLESGIRVIALTSSKPLRKNRGSLLVRIANRAMASINSITIGFQHYRFIRREKIDLLHINNGSGAFMWLIAAKIARVPCVTHQRAMITDAFILRLALRCFNSVICISEAVRSSFKNANLDKLPLVTIHNALDPFAVKVTRTSVEIRQVLGIESTKKLVGIVANIQRWKGQDVVIHAINNILQDCPDIVCLLIGALSPNEADDIKFDLELQKLIHDNNLSEHVIMTGYCPDVANFMNALEIVIHASVSPEPFGRVLLEGMALRKPIIACRAGGVTEIVVDGETGLLYNPGDIQDLSDCLRTLYHDPKKCNEMGEAGYSRLVKQFNIKQNISATQDIYLSLLSNVK